MDNKNIHTLSEAEIKEINSRYLNKVDKFRRCDDGIASDLERYDKDIIYLRVATTEKQGPPTYQDALNLAISWKEENPELSQAKGFVTSFYKTEMTGFDIDLKGKNKEDSIKLIFQLTQKMIEANKKELELINIFAGLFSNKTI